MTRKKNPKACDSLYAEEEDPCSEWRKSKDGEIVCLKCFTKMACGFPLPELEHSNEPQSKTAKSKQKLDKKNGKN